MIPKQDDSGESSKKGLNITKDGPARYRRALYLASDTARQCDPPLAGREEAMVELEAELSRQIVQLRVENEWLKKISGV
jgi:hypothetical protein